MFVSSAEVSTAIQSSLGDFDLVAGTEEEIRIAGGSTETQNALKAIRDTTDALIVLKDERRNLYQDVAGLWRSVPAQPGA